MALELINAATEQENMKHEVRHDLESFIWVLPYVLLKRASRNHNYVIGDVDEVSGKKNMEKFDTFIKDRYGATQLSTLVDKGSSRNVLKKLNTVVRTEEPTSGLLSDLADRLLLSTVASELGHKPKYSDIKSGKLTYEILLEDFNSAVEGHEMLSRPDVKKVRIDPLD